MLCQPSATCAKKSRHKDGERLFFITSSFDFMPQQNTLNQAVYESTLWGRGQEKNIIDYKTNHHMLGSLYLITLA